MNELNIENNNQRFVAMENEYKFIPNKSYNNISEEIEKRKQENISEGMKKYMPIGSVVKITGTDQLNMIIGFNYNNNGTVYDYVSCLYPYGISGGEKMNIFNHDQIDSVYFIGYLNSKGKQFKEELNIMNLHKNI